VNKILKFYGIIALTAIYGVALCVSNTQYTEFRLADKPATEKGFFSPAVNGLFSHTNPTENLGGSSTHFSLSNWEKSLPTNWQLTKQASLLLNAIFLQYNNSIIGFPGKSRKTDGIFPFHYFW
jgi:hypothetical protein